MIESPAHNWDDEIVAQIGKVGGEYCLKMVIPSKNFLQGFLLITTVKGWISTIFFNFLMIVDLKVKFVALLLN